MSLPEADNRRDIFLHAHETPRLDKDKEFHRPSQYKADIAGSQTFDSLRRGEMSEHRGLLFQAHGGLHDIRLLMYEKLRFLFS